MIVKNESKIIVRLLESVEKIIDTYCICDTGSTDDTVTLIESFFKERNIPGKIVYEPFRDFGHNRSFALNACKNQKDADYILLLDADMIFYLDKKISPSAFKHALCKANAFSIFQGTDKFYYKNTRIVKNNMDTSYWGVTHEYLNLPPNTLNLTLEREQVFIKDVGDGGCKTDKFERDVALLKRGLEEHPNNSRYIFYLANSYLDSGQCQNAIDTYQMRIEMGGWNEEVWYCYYRIGKAYMQMNDVQNAIYYWMEGYNFYPNRIENVYEIVKHYRTTNKTKLAVWFYCMANHSRNTYKQTDSLFLQKDVYDYKLDYEMSILGYYYNPNNINMQIFCMNVLANLSDGSNTCKSILKNYKFYASAIKEWDVLDQNKKDVLQNCSNYFGSDDFVSSTPSIVYDQSGNLVVNVRYVNYRINETGGYDNQSFIETKNRLSIIDTSTKNEWFIKSATTIKHDTLHDCRYIGIEDVRLYWSEQLSDSASTSASTSTSASASASTSASTSASKLLYNANRGLIDGRMVIEHGSIDPNTGQTVSGFMIKPDQAKCEKNWTMFSDVVSKRVKVVYNWSPMIIGDIGQKDHENNCNFIQTHEIKTPSFFKHLRGSTNGLTIESSGPDGNEIWFICHTVSYEDRRYYYHIFVVLDANTYAVKKYSPYFTFEKNKVEYTLGFVHSPDTKQFLIGYSLMDKQTEYIEIPKEKVDQMMISV